MTANIWLLGTKSFGREVGKVLDLKYNLVGVTSPKHDDACTAWATEHGIYMGWNADASLIPRHVDLIVTAHWTGYIDTRMRAAARRGVIVGHPSLLPRHRGIAAVEHTILAKDPIAGFSWFRPVDELDAGPIVHQKWCHVDPNWDASALWREALFPMGVQTVGQAVSKALAGIACEQNEAFATLAPRLVSR